MERKAFHIVTEFGFFEVFPFGRALSLDLDFEFVEDVFENALFALRAHQHFGEFLAVHVFVHELLHPVLESVQFDVLATQQLAVIVLDFLFHLSVDRQNRADAQGLLAQQILDDFPDLLDFVHRR